jgi:hypothetical protein
MERAEVDFDVDVDVFTVEGAKALATDAIESRMIELLNFMVSFLNYKL